jgi:hypothetical protein
VAFGQREAMIGVDLQDSADRLVLEPLARVASVSAGARGQFVGRSRAMGVQAAVVAQPVAEVDAGKIERGQARASAGVLMDPPL